EEGFVLPRINEPRRERWMVPVFAALGRFVRPCAAIPPRHSSRSYRVDKNESFSPTFPLALSHNDADSQIVHAESGYFSWLTAAAKARAHSQDPLNDLRS